MAVNEFRASMTFCFREVGTGEASEVMRASSARIQPYRGELPHGHAVFWPIGRASGSRGSAARVRTRRIARRRSSLPGRTVLGNEFGVIAVGLSGTACMPCFCISFADTYDSGNRCTLVDELHAFALHRGDVGRDRRPTKECQRTRPRPLDTSVRRLDSCGALRPIAATRRTRNDADLRYPEKLLRDERPVGVRAVET